MFEFEGTTPKQANNCQKTRINKTKSDTFISDFTHMYVRRAVFRLNILCHLHCDYLHDRRWCRFIGKDRQKNLWHKVIRWSLHTKITGYDLPQIRAQT